MPGGHHICSVRTSLDYNSCRIEALLEGYANDEPAVASSRIYPATHPPPPSIMDEVRSKIAQYIAGEVKLDELIDSHRISVPVQKRFMFEDTWVTMNRKIAEAVISTTDNSNASDRKWKPTAIQERRRNAVTVTDPKSRLMTNGKQWPRMEDWVVSADCKIRYAPLLQPLRQLGQEEWALPELAASTEATVEAPAPLVQDRHSPVSNSAVSDKTYQTYGNLTPASYNATAYTDSTS